MKNHMTYEGVVYYPDSSRDYSYFYYGENPGPQLDSNGDPVISLVGGGENWFLQVSVKWQAPPTQVDRLVTHLRKKELIKSAMDLKPAPIEVRKVELTLKTTEAPVILAKSGSSGHYPFGAALNAGLSDKFQKLVTAAFHGQKDLLLIIYHASLKIESPVDLELSGPVHPALQNLNKNSSVEEIREWLENEIRNGNIKISKKSEKDLPQKLSEESFEKLYQEATSEIQNMLKRAEKMPDDSFLQIQVKESFAFVEEFTASTDISTWFKKNPDDHIKVVA